MTQAPCITVSTPLSASLDVPLPVLGADVLVPLASGGQIDYAALDCAASAPAARAVWDEVAAFAPHYAGVHRGAGQLSLRATELFERSRAEVAAFLGCRPGDQVVFTRSTTDSLNLLAGALPEGTRVFAFASEHHALLLPWRRHPLTCLPVPRSAAEAVRAVDEALAARPAGTPALLCVTGASNVTGELWPVRELVAVARRHGARVVLDAAQLAPHRAVDLGELDVDWVAFSGHKLYAPFGSGVLAGRGDWLSEAEPYLAGGGATRVVTRGSDGRLAVEWARDEARHEAGSPNVIGALAVAAACRALAAVGFEAIEAHERRLLGVVREGLASVPGVRELSLFGSGADRVAVVSFTVAGREAADAARELSERYGIGVRAGMFCAQPLVRELLDAEADAGCEGPEAAVRVSFGAGTPLAHAERLVLAVRELAA
ncbi:aminotransferase class V-fold PLP-dependent enzyme [Streptomyces radicis]|uniref:Aminotransferase class V-fold PLP-dependent enzyme n=1 Tax=Streptomyces radicis TaxID=1750517 RepID=A0A3A9VZX9_9ACTN|nr:aminotransferase class V-fold PLP-dependent enzyme [Streptomyces radicis]RKN06260.1 aminotransferase class V-fold PLP-dependent enzyme [Streptomyces radicis]RKN18590.1 aminotransferase class V-fold PLP-dependent enzyme [Streptomyces radicis]